MRFMDTWASSLTLQIAGGWGDPRLFSLVFLPLRSQGQDIIRTWLFSTVLRAELEHGQVPWTGIWLHRRPRPQEDVKSKGNVVTPAHAR